VKNTIDGKITPLVPASVLQQHPATWIFLDKASASFLGKS
jgi:6-phosphogluconolactonase/glucosamine-6-phosphate isomerase/deaminase